MRSHCSRSLRLETPSQNELDPNSLHHGKAVGQFVASSPDFSKCCKTIPKRFKMFQKLKTQTPASYLHHLTLIFEAFLRDAKLCPTNSKLAQSNHVLNETTQAGPEVRTPAAKVNNGKIWIRFVNSIQVRSFTCNWQILQEIWSTANALCILNNKPQALRNATASF